jgi:hypothetical protein
MHVLKTPVSYRLGKRGHDQAARTLTQCIAKTSDRIVACEQDLCFRNDIIRELAYLAAA